MEYREPPPKFSEKIPAEIGFGMPAEWSPHSGTWLAWPHNADTWPGDKLEKVRALYAAMTAVLLEREKVHLFVGGPSEEENVAEALRGRGAKTGNLDLRRVPVRDAWIRDWGPVFLKRKTDGAKACCKWAFNAWGGKYPERSADNEVFADAPAMTGCPAFRGPLVLEGGAIDVNGLGTGLATRSSVLNPNRNPDLTEAGAEKILRDFLGVERLIWLDAGIAGDDTDGHIDNLARFVGPDTIAACFEDDPRDVNYGPLLKNWEKLRRAVDERGGAWRLVKLPMPGTVGGRMDRLPASYANFYAANGTIFLPSYGHACDSRAEKIFRELFPKHEIVPLDCTDLVYGLGAIHCVTQQEPV